MYMRSFKPLLKAAALAGAAMLPLAGGAMAADFARVSTDLNVRAGPSSRFPVVTTVPDNSRVMVHGCVSGYEWCDVSYQDYRGWVFADYLNYRFQGHYVPIVDYGDRIDLPVIGFSIGAYWDDYYHGRPWYRDRDRWVGLWRDNGHYEDYRRGHESRRDRGHRDRYRMGDRDRDTDMRDRDEANRGERYRDRDESKRTEYDNRKSGDTDADRRHREANRNEERGREQNAMSDREERQGQINRENREANKSGRRPDRQSPASDRDYGGSSSGASSGESGKGSAQSANRPTEPIRGGGDQARSPGERHK